MEKTMNRRVGLSNGTIDLIWTKLPFCHLPKCRQVCKQWNNLVLTMAKFNNPSISNNNLFFAHLSHSSSNLHCLDFDPNDSKGDVDIVASFTFHPSWPSTYVKIVNSCNGLVCFCFRNKLKEICVLNPMINEYVYTDFVAKKGMRDSSYSYGFGFSFRTKRYKIVRYSPTSPGYPDSTLVEIMEFGTSSTISEWRYVGVVPFSLDKDAIYFNGALFWVGTHSKRTSLYHDQRSNYVLQFDVEDEAFQKICFPELPTDEGGEPMLCFLGVFHGTLYLTFRQGSSSEYQVWKMDGCCSWIKAFVIPMPTGAMRLQLIKVCGDGRILCLAPGFNLILYNPTTDEVQILKLRAEFKQIYRVHPIDSFHFDSLHRI